MKLLIKLQPYRNRVIKIRNAISPDSAGGGLKNEDEYVWENKYGQDCCEYGVVR